jgi:hypothetical protein
MNVGYLKVNVTKICCKDMTGVDLALDEVNNCWLLAQDSYMVVSN